METQANQATQGKQGRAAPVPVLMIVDATGCNNKEAMHQHMQSRCRLTESHFGWHTHTYALRSAMHAVMAPASPNPKHNSVVDALLTRAGLADVRRGLSAHARRPASQPALLSTRYTSVAWQRARAPMPGYLAGPRYDGCPPTCTHRGRALQMSSVVCLSKRSLHCACSTSARVRLRAAAGVFQAAERLCRRCDPGMMHTHKTFKSAAQTAHALLCSRPCAPCFKSRSTGTP